MTDEWVRSIENESRNISYADYKLIMSASSSILSSKAGGTAFFDFNRSTIAKQAYEQFKNGQRISANMAKNYMIRALSPVTWSEISKSEFENIKKVYDGASLQVAMLDQNLFSWLQGSVDNKVILGTGGSCALENQDTKYLLYLKQRPQGEEDIYKYVSHLINDLPTWTQITGAFIPVRGLTIFYDETYPWYLKLEKTGIKDAQKVTEDIYRKIYEGSVRYAKLFHPDNEILRIPFLSLDFERKGLLKEWYNMYEKYIRQLEDIFQLPPLNYHHDEFVRAWVEYTYAGPSILQTDLDFIKETYPDIYKKNRLHDATIHVRGKKIDHFTIERLNYWEHEIILDPHLKYSEHQKRLLTSYSKRSETALGMWYRDHLPSYPSIGFAGKLDSNYEGQLMDEKMLLTPKDITQMSIEKLIEIVLKSPLRLHRNNVEQVVEYFNQFVIFNTLTVPSNQIKNIAHIQSNIAKLEKKQQVIHKIVYLADVFKRIFEESMRVGEKVTIPVELKYFWTEEELIEGYSLLVQRHKIHLQSIKKIYNHSNHEEITKELLNLISACKISKSDKLLQLVIDVKHKTVLQEFIELLTKQIDNDKIYLNTLESQINQQRSSLQEIINSIVERIVKKNTTGYIDNIKILPLSDNLVVSYLQQLLFIPSIRTAYVEMSEIEKDKKLSFTEKEELIKQSIHNILPVLTACIKFVMSNDMEYPWYHRYDFPYKKVRL